MLTAPKKIAVINDISGYGRCALTVALPIISAMGLQCCPVPTSIFSNHTAYPTFFFDDYTDRMPSYIAKWKELGFTFDGILTGFLGSAAQIDIVEQFFREFGNTGAKIIIDPIMGDHGTTYATYTPEMCERMKQLITHADLITPNLTEACILTDTSYREHFSRKELTEIIIKLAKRCHGSIVISGIDAGSYLCNAIYEPGCEILWQKRKRVAAERCGTGDVFSSILAAEAVQNKPLLPAVKKASAFVSRCLAETSQCSTDKNEGVYFEPLLRFL
ncbi:MAG: pyridoxamine kinase [Lachnospiraceae bacterium]|nr:pyridoxamine kinase [Lachnospiraceae bacterium]